MKGKKKNFVMYKSVVKFHPLKATYVVNCIGVFNSDFFTAIELRERAEHAYLSYKWGKENNNIDQMKTSEDIYNTCEVMRVNLLNYVQTKVGSEYND